MRIPLLSGAYQAESLIADAQRSINLYAEVNPGATQIGQAYGLSSGAPVPMTHYLTPGLTLLAGAANVQPVRCIYRATNGDGYCVIGTIVYYFDAKFAFTQVGTVADLRTPCYMADNGLAIVLVDGTAAGYAINLATREFAAITGAPWYGSTSVDYVDTYFLFNRPGTDQWYISLSFVTFDMLTGTAGAIYDGEISAGGTGYTNGSYPAQALTGGSGSGATANITVAGGVVTAATMAGEGSGYVAGDVLSAFTGTDGAIGAGAITAGGTSYTTGTYTAVPLTGGAGTGAQATVVISGGAVTSVTITAAGSGYAADDALSATAASIGGTGSGFAYEVSAVQGGFIYDVTGVHGSAFDPLDIVAKQSGADSIQRVFELNRMVWAVGTLSGDVYYNSGASDFTFQALPGSIEHGAAAPYSFAKQDVNAFWLTQDRQGTTIIAQTNGMALDRISTHAIENTLRGYANISDAIGFCYQQNGHSFYFLTFPTADATWVYDITAKQWHQRAATDLNGVLRRHRANCYAFVYGKHVVGDWQNGRLYELDIEAYTDNGLPITRIRSFPHILNDGKRAVVSQFIADMEVGELPETLWKTGQPTIHINPDRTISLGNLNGAPTIHLGELGAMVPMVSLRTSITRGASWGNAVMQTMGATGRYQISMSWRRLGIARDFVFELEWSIPAKTALNGAFIEAHPAGT